MTEKERKAIEWLKEKIDFWNINNIKNTHEHILLNLIEKQQKEIEEIKAEYIAEQKQELAEIEKKNKIIDLIAEDYSKYQTLRSYPNEITETAFGIKDRIIKQYFERKSEDG